MLDHDLGKTLFAAKIGRLIIVLPDDKGSDGWYFRFIVISRHAVVADERIGHDYGLIGVGWIRKDFLIPHHGGVEYDLQYLVTGVSKSESIVFFTILQNQFSVIAHVHHC